MKAADVAASFNAAIAGKNNVVAGMTSAEARDDHTVVVNTDTVNIEVPLLVSRLIIVPASLADTDALEDRMVGTGPYSFSTWDRGRQIEFTKNDKYWGTPATFDVLTWTFTSDSAVRANSLKAGEVDIAHDLSTDDAAQLPNTVSGPVSQVLCMRVKYAPGQPLGDPNVRMAAAMAIDQKAIIDGIYRGRASMPNGHAVIGKVFGTDPNMRDYPYDPAKARALLEQAWKVGQTLTISTAQTRWDKSREIAQAIQDMLNKVGFDAQVSYDDESSWREKLFATSGGVTEENLKAAPDLTFVVNGNVVFTSYGTLRVYSSKGEYPGGDDQEYAQAVLAAAGATETGEKEQLYQKAWNLMHDHGLVFPIIALHQSHGIAENVSWKLSEIIPIYARDISFKSTS